MADHKINYSVELTKTGDGAQQAVTDLQGLQQQTEKNQQAFAQLDQQAQSALKTMAAIQQALGASGQGGDAGNPLNDLLAGDGPGSGLAASLAVQQQDLQAYYQSDQDMAAANKDAILNIEAQQTAQMQPLLEQRKQASQDLYDQLTSLGDTAETRLAGGLARTFTSIIDGTKSAGQAFQEFAKTFLDQIAQMILQLVILDTLKSVLSFGDGGQAVSPAARGGMFTAAAAGVMLAAAGLQGVAEVDSPTYLPRFNVLAGEAGREVLTVMAQPQLGHVNGAPVMLGNVGAEKLALLSQESLGRMVNGAQPRLMAEGGFSALPTSSSSAPPSSSSGNGKIQIDINLAPGLEGEMVKNSVDQSLVAVAVHLQTDTPISQATKRLVT
jgi:hypothetical protein